MKNKSSFDSILSDQIEQIISYRQMMITLFFENAPFLLTRATEISSDFLSMILISQVDENHLAATSVITTAQTILKGVASVFLYYGGILTGQVKEKNASTIGKILHCNWLLALALGIVGLIVTTFNRAIFIGLGQPEQITGLIDEYLRAYSYGLPFIQMLVANQQTMLGVAHPWLTFIVAIAIKPLYVLLGYCLLHGISIFPKLGISGVGYAHSLLSLIGFLLGLYFFKCKKEFQLMGIYQFKPTFDYAILCKLIKYGLPIALYATVELGNAFLLSILVGRYYGIFHLAAIQPALQYGSFLSNITFTVSTTTGILVSRYTIRDSLQNAKRQSIVGTLVSLSIPLLVILTFLITNNMLIHPFINDDSQLMFYAHRFLLINLIGQLFDGIRNSVTGTLRGYKETSFPMKVNMLCNLCFNLPLALLATQINTKSPALIFISRVLTIFITAGIISRKWYALVKLSMENDNQPKNHANLSDCCSKLFRCKKNKTPEETKQLLPDHQSKQNELVLFTQ